MYSVVGMEAGKQQRGGVRYGTVPDARYNKTGTFMTASLISPSGKVLLHRARCSGEAGTDPFATTVRVRAAPEPERMRASTSVATPRSETERAELDTAS